MRFTAAAIGTGVGVLSLFVFLLPPDKHPLLIPHFSLDHLGQHVLDRATQLVQERLSIMKVLLGELGRRDHIGGYLVDELQRA